MNARPHNALARAKWAQDHGIDTTEVGWYRKMRKMLNFDPETRAAMKAEVSHASEPLMHASVCVGMQEEAKAAKAADRNSASLATLSASTLRVD